jgi:hypothetical protein
LITIGLLIALAAAALLILFDPGHALVGPAWLTTGLLLVVAIVVRLFGWFKPRRRRGYTPPSLVTEMERLYFRSMREMLNEHTNLAQVVNDLQRILAIDPHYKNARHYLNRALVLQAQNQGSDADKYSPTRTDAEFRKLQEQLIDPDAAVRKTLVMELIQYGERAIDPLIALLMDEDSDVRVHAATALGWVGGRDALAPLLVALQDENNYVRRYAARAICWVITEPNDDAVESLIAGLRDEDSYVRRYAARALGWSQDRKAIRPLLELLSMEENGDVREYAFTALDDLGERSVNVERLLPITE